MTHQLRKDIIEFLTPLPLMQSETSRRAALLTAGLDAILRQTDLSGSSAQAAVAIVYALEQHGVIDDTLALVVFLRYVASTLGSDKQLQITAWCKELLAAQPAENTAKHASKPQVFLCYARVDQQTAKRVYADLQAAGAEPWMDTANLLPGQKWRDVIRQAISKSAYVLVLLSPGALSSRGFLQRELKEALSVVATLPPTEVFVIPVRIHPCAPRHTLLKQLHWVDLFPEYTIGFQQILRVIATPTTSTSPITGHSRTIVSLWGISLGAILLLLLGILTAISTNRFLTTFRYSTPQSLPTSGVITVSTATPAPTVMSPLPSSTQIAPTSTPEPFEIGDLPSEPSDLSAVPGNDLGLGDLPSETSGLGVIPSPPAPEPDWIHLRSEPMMTTISEKFSAFIDNQFEAQGNVVVDHATGLMWQQAGSDNQLTYDSANAYIGQLNYQRFAGYSNWRLPTMPELFSLVEPTQKKGDLYIDPVFDATQRHCWSADKRIAADSFLEPAWHVAFFQASGWYAANSYYVRAVRSCIPNEEQDTLMKPVTVPTITPGSPAPTPQPTHQPTPSAQSWLRREPKAVPEKEFKAEFGLDEHQRPLSYIIKHDYEVRNSVVIDYVTGLMWTQAGSSSYTTYPNAQQYIRQLNQQQFSGYTDWRLPTIPELLSLLEPTPKHGNLHIDPVFEANQPWYWSADPRPIEGEIVPEWVWFVNFRGGYVSWVSEADNNSIRAVRSLP